MKVLKFGGGCLKSAQDIKLLPGIVEDYYNDGVFLVLSAFGKTTNLLEDNQFDLVFDSIKNLINKLGMSPEIRRSILSLPLSPSFPYSLDYLKSFFDSCHLKPNLIKDSNNFLFYPALVSIGEYISSKIIYYYLSSVLNKSSVLLDAALCIQTDPWNSRDNAAVFKCVTIDNKYSPFYGTPNKIKVDRNCIPKDKIIITQGFISSNIYHLNSGIKQLVNKQRTTLGREGSDYSAAIFGNLLSSEEVVLFKDVNGVYNLNPKTHINAKLFKALTYEQAYDLCDSGSTIIHPKTIMHLQSKKIPLRVKNFFDLNQTGTIIS